MRLAAICLTALILGASACGSDDTTAVEKQPCSDVTFDTGYPEKAIGIQATGMTCGDAEPVIKAAHRPCKLPPDPGEKACVAAGFACTLAEEPHTSTVPIQCRDEDRRIVWAWFGGY